MSFETTAAHTGPRAYPNADTPHPGPDDEMDNAHSNSRQRAPRLDQPARSDAAVTGSVGPLPPRPSMPASTDTLTQENFACWLAEQRQSDWDPPDGAAAWDDGYEALDVSPSLETRMQKQPAEDALRSTDPAAMQEHHCASSISDIASPAVGQEYAHSPASVSAWAPITRPSVSSGEQGSPASKLSLPPSSWVLSSAAAAEQDGEIAPWPPLDAGQPHDRDFLGIGMFAEADLQQGQSATVRPLRYKPSATWYHLWLT